MPLNRREFIKKRSQMTLGIGTTAIYLPVLSKAIVQKKDEKDEIINDKKYLSEILYTKKEIDDWLAGKAFPFSKYHSEFGWLVNNASFKDGSACNRFFAE